MMNEMLANTILEQREEVPFVDCHGKRWSTVNEIYSPKFQLKDRKVVRERWSLRKKIQQKDERGKEVGLLWKSLYGETIILIEELVEKEDTKG